MSNDDGEALEHAAAVDVDAATPIEEYEDAEMVQVSHLVPEPLRDAAKREADHGELSERVRTVYRLVATGGVVADRDIQKLRLQQLRNEIDQVRAREENARTERRALERQAQRAEERIMASEGRQDKYEGYLESLEQELRDGRHVFAGRTTVENAASLVGKTPDAVIEDLQARNPNIPERAFKPKSDLEPHERWTGVDDAGAEWEGSNA